MKHIMLSVRPEHVCNILNKQKLLEIRKSVPKEVLNGEECICELYCTKGKPYLYRINDDDAFDVSNNQRFEEDTSLFVKDYDAQNGKVVARFHSRKCEEYGYFYSPAMFKNDYYTIENKKLDYKSACITKEQVIKYADDGKLLPKPIYAWHIEDLHIYDKPKELAEFGLKRPFQSWGYLKDESVYD